MFPVNPGIEGVQPGAGSRARLPARVRAGAQLAATLVALTCLPTLGGAQEAGSVVLDDRDVPDGDNVVEAIATDEGNWLVGTTLELTAGSTNSLEDELLFGLSVTRRFDALGIGFKLAVDPVEVGRALGDEREGGIEKHRALFQLHARYTFETLGMLWSYGIGGQAEARIERHFALFYVTPIELGAVLYQAGSNYLQLFVGLRVLAVGELLNHFLIDPNGYDSDSAREDLREEEDLPAEAFIGLAFTRRVD